MDNAAAKLKASENARKTRKAEKAKANATLKSNTPNNTTTPRTNTTTEKQRANNTAANNAAAKKAANNAALKNLMTGESGGPGGNNTSLLGNNVAGKEAAAANAAKKAKALEDLKKIKDEEKRVQQAYRNSVKNMSNANVNAQIKALFENATPIELPPSATNKQKKALEDLKKIKEQEDKVMQAYRNSVKNMSNANVNAKIKSLFENNVPSTPNSGNTTPFTNTESNVESPVAVANNKKNNASSPTMAINKTKRFNSIFSKIQLVKENLNRLNQTLKGAHVGSLPSDVPVNTSTKNQASSNKSSSNKASSNQSANAPLPTQEELIAKGLEINTTKENKKAKQKNGKGKSPFTKGPGPNTASRKRSNRNQRRSRRRRN
jgi:hypothetical protein